MLAAVLQSFPARAALSPAIARILLALAIAAAMAAGFLVTPADAAGHAVAGAGVELTRLLRAMAALKLLMVAVAAAAIFWRLGSMITPPRFGAYVLASAAMAAGPGLIWDMEYVRSGAALLHGGLLACVLLFWRDPIVGERLAGLVAARRLRC
jgi:hypothetical protein